MEAREIPVGEKGFSLVELMVAMTIGLFLMLGVFHIYFGASSSNRLGADLARVQETGRFALDYLSREVRRVGYQGCFSVDAINVIDIEEADGGDVDILAHEFRGFSVASDASSITPAWAEMPALSDLMPLSDVLYITGAEEDSVNVSCSGSSCESSGNGFAVDDLVLVTDCSSADLFRVSSGALSSATFGLAGTLSAEYVSSPDDTALDARAMKYSTKTFFVADTGRLSGRGAVIPALYIRGGDWLLSNTREYAEGIEKLVVEYGQRLGGGNMRYVRADDAGLDFSAVEAVRIHVLAVSSDAVLSEDDSREYTLGMVTVAPSSDTSAAVTYDATDRRLRRAFSTTVLLRNRR